MKYVSTDENGIVVDVYDDPNIDPNVQKIEISEDSFRMLGTRPSLGDFQIQSLSEGIQLTNTAKIEMINSAVQSMLDAKARAKGYDSIHTAALRAALPNSPFHTEGVAFGEWMDQCNHKLYHLLDQWKSGEIQEMTTEEVLSVMPACPVPV